MCSSDLPAHLIKVEQGAMHVTLSEKAYWFGITIESLRRREQLRNKYGYGISVAVMVLYRELGVVLNQLKHEWAIISLVLSSTWQLIQSDSWAIKKFIW